MNAYQFSDSQLDPDHAMGTQPPWQSRKHQLCISNWQKKMFSMRFFCRIGLQVMAVVAVAYSLAVLGPLSVARAQCVNEPLREEEPHALALPDCRAYEQVSPVDKNLVDALGSAGNVQASRQGTGLIFFALAPFPSFPEAEPLEGAPVPPFYLSSFGSGSWSTRGLLPRSAPGAAASVQGWAEDLATAVLSVEDSAKEPPLTTDKGVAPGQTNYYVRNSEDGSYGLLAPGPGKAQFAAATHDGSQILFEDDAKLTGDAVAGVPNLYEWDRGQVSLVGLLPAMDGGGAPEHGAIAGAAQGISKQNLYTQNTISEDGRCVFFTDLGTGQIYVREDGAVTVEVSKSRGGPIETERPAHWRAATPDGRYVFFTSEARLTEDSTASNGAPDLYRFDVEDESLEDLSHSEGGGVLGVLGVSDDGTYAYFVTLGGPNIYVWHEGRATLVARLNRFYDVADWRDYWESEPAGPAQGFRSSRVTPDGKTLLFTSVNYDSAGYSEILRYDASTAALACVSCDPNAPSPASNAYLVYGELVASANPGSYLFNTRNLSESGDEVFFQTREGLVPQDTNGQMDVYEWEREGTGSCPVGQGDCRYLISTGASPDESYFGDASANGEDVFFFTRQALVRQDRDNNVDAYDARVGGGLAAQNPPATVPCDGEACREVGGSTPALGIPSSMAISSASGVSVGENAPKGELKPLTRRQRLTRALRVCGKLRKARRSACRTRARSRYGRGSKAAKARLRRR
jgi:hypothetical protein